MNKHIGSSFNDWLDDDGIREDVETHAWKRVLAWQIGEAMQEKNITKTDMAKRMNTSRAAVNRLLNPDEPSLTLITLNKAAHAVGKRINLSVG